MPEVKLGDVTLHYRLDGPENGAPLVFAHALGTDLHVWDGLLPHLPPGLRLLRFDMRGHGRSSVPPAPYSMGALIRDAERLMEHVGMTDAAFLGLSIGGMVAQGLAVKRLDLIRVLILSNTAAKIGQSAMWESRIEAVRKGGIEALADATMARWFSRPFREAGQHSATRAMLTAQPPEGYCGAMAAIAGTDFYTPTSGLRLPTLAIAGSEDGSTPPDLVRETAALIPGSRFQLIRRAGHLPHLEQPEAYAAALTGFLSETDHLPPP